MSIFGGMLMTEKRVIFCKKMKIVIKISCFPGGLRVNRLKFLGRYNDDKQLRKKRGSRFHHGSSFTLRQEI
jgi:hypothetical protein